MSKSKSVKSISSPNWDSSSCPSAPGLRHTSEVSSSSSIFAVRSSPVRLGRTTGTWWFPARRDSECPSVRIRPQWPHSSGVTRCAQQAHTLPPGERWSVHWLLKLPSGTVGVYVKVPEMYIYWSICIIFNCLLLLDNISEANIVLFLLNYSVLHLEPSVTFQIVPFNWWYWSK